MSLYAHVLHSKGYRVTPGRVRLLSILSRAGIPLTIKEILARSRGRVLNSVTLYRALRSLSETGIVTRIDLNRSVARYEYAPKKAHHHHLVCLGCARVEDFTGCDERKIIRTALEQAHTFTAVRNHSLELFGWCHACATKSTTFV
jgi:Fur family ferric uptake transcriptional regulator